MNQLITVKVKNNQQLVSARELHKGLQIKRRFSLWVEQNFKDFEKDTDFTSVLGSTVVNNGARKPIQDYALTLDMAKELSMMSHTELGKKFRRYFIEVEKKYKLQQIDTKQLSPELQMFDNLFKAIANNELANKRLESKIDKISEIVALNNADWRKNSRLLIIKMTRVPGVSREFKEIQADIYKELDRRAAADVQRRLVNMRNRMAGEGVPKQRRNRLNKLDVIAEDKRLKEIYLAIVKEYAIKFGVNE